ASWDPRQLLGSWLVQRLAADYPALGGPEAVERLLQARLIAPVLDGLDEMSPDRRRTALRRLNESHGDGMPLIVTCRAAEYDALVREEDVLRGAAVLRAEPLTPADALAYLTAVVSPLHERAWQPLFSLLAGRLPCPLVDVSTTPLMLGLLRVYANGGGDPQRLLRIGTAEELADFLLDALVPTVFADRPDGPRWRADRAEQWLGWLAREMTQREEAELQWWQLHERSSRRERALTAAAFAWVGAVPALVAAGVPSWRPGAVVDWLVIALGAGVVAGVVARSAGRPVGLPVLREGYGIRPGSPLSRVPRPLLIGVPLLVLVLWSVWSVVSLVQEYAWERHHVGPQPSVFPVAFLLLAVAVLTNRHANVLAAGSPRRVEAADPARALALGRRRALRPALLVGGVWAVLVGGMLLPAGAGRLTALVVAVLVGALAGTLRVVHSLWYAYQHARLRLALTGRLPLRLAAFLDDAHRLGVLRQVGQAYQFRHERLRRRLAADRVRP
ncbi:hypothetical protein ACFW1A_40185, partial [Kitasatospora sp. NPDC058965]|uniref:hypothetical protein n=1 Tax=Kitasatospora sp. NPDC058965 TaxID=3346682 RepID=UPI00368C9212